MSGCSKGWKYFGRDHATQYGCNCFDSGWAIIRAGVYKPGASERHHAAVCDLPGVARRISRGRALGRIPRGASGRGAGADFARRIGMIAPEVRSRIQSLKGRIPRRLRRNELQRPKGAVERSQTTKCMSGVK